MPAPRSSDVPGAIGGPRLPTPTPAPAPPGTGVPVVSGPSVQERVPPSGKPAPDDVARRAEAEGTQVPAAMLPQYKTGTGVRMVFVNHTDGARDGEEIDVTMYRVVRGTSPLHIWNYRRTEFDDTARGHETVSAELVINEDRWRTAHGAFPIGRVFGDILLDHLDGTGDWLVEGWAKDHTRRFSHEAANYVTVTVVFKTRKPIAEYYAGPGDTEGASDTEATPKRSATLVQLTFKHWRDNSPRVSVAYSPEVVRELAGDTARGFVIDRITGTALTVEIPDDETLTGVSYRAPVLVAPNPDRPQNTALSNVYAWDLNAGSYVLVGVGWPDPRTPAPIHAEITSALFGRRATSAGAAPGPETPAAAGIVRSFNIGLGVSNNTSVDVLTPEAYGIAHTADPNLRFGFNGAVTARAQGAGTRPPTAFSGAIVAVGQQGLWTQYVWNLSANRYEQVGQPASTEPVARPFYGSHAETCAAERAAFGDMSLFQLPADRWSALSLTVRYQNAPSPELEAAARRGLAQWTGSGSPVRLREVTGEADLDVRWELLPDNILGRGEIPNASGRSSLALSLALNAGSTEETVAHEAGHAFGLRHVRDPDSLLFPTDNASVMRVRPQEIAELRALMRRTDVTVHTPRSARR